MIKHKTTKNTYYYILKYFYSWYILPLVFLHEICHMSMAYLVGIKSKLKFIKNDPLINGTVFFKHKNKFHWKWYLITYAPLLLLSPLFLMFFNQFFLYVSVYLISTIIIYKKKVICICLPSKTDIFFLKKLKYFNYIIKETSEEIFNNYLKRNSIHILLYKRKLLDMNEFFKQEKTNKKDNISYKILNYIKNKLKKT